MEKFIVIGDVHGCVDEFFDLLDSTNSFVEGRTIVSVGDLLDKNPGTNNYAQLLDFFMATNSVVVLGNHEERHLRFERNENRGSNKMAPAKDPESHVDFWDTRRQLTSTHFEFLSRQKYSFIHSDFSVIHGGLEQGKTIEQMHPDAMCRVRCLNTQGKMVRFMEILPDMSFWTERYSGPDRIVYGHSPFLNPRIENNTVGIDTGCVHGNRLSAWLFPENETVSVASRRVYASPLEVLK